VDDYKDQVIDEIIQSSRSKSDSRSKANYTNLKEERQRIKDPRMKEMFDKNSIYKLLEKKEQQIQRFKEKETFKINSDHKSHKITSQQHDQQLKDLNLLLESKYLKLDKQKILINNWLSIVNTIMLDEEPEEIDDESLENIEDENLDDSVETRRLKRI